MVCRFNIDCSLVLSCVVVTLTPFQLQNCSNSNSKWLVRAVLLLHITIKQEPMSVLSLQTYVHVYYD